MYSGALFLPQWQALYNPIGALGGWRGEYLGIYGDYRDQGVSFLRHLLRPKV